MKAAGFNQVQWLQAEVGKLASQLAQRRATIQRKEKKITELVGKLKDKDEEIAQLKAQLATSEQSDVPLRVVEGSSVP